MRSRFFKQMGNTTRALLLALVGAVVVVGALDSAHLHAVDTADNCLICGQSDHTPAAQTPPSQEAAHVALPASSTLQPAATQAAPLHAYAVRAPPAV